LADEVCRHAEALNDEIKEHYLPMLSNVTMSREALLNPNMQRAQELKDAAAAERAESTPGPADDEETGITVDPSTGLVRLAPPRQLEWYPGHLAWQLDVPKRVVRKSAEFKVFQRFLVGETEIGNISRQEAVSMIPPLLLDIASHHVCLDMCAAPGSKTAQMMEALNHHATVTTGLLIANDADLKRCHMLVHQTGRMPSVGLGVTNNDASKIPTFKITPADGGKPTALLYDRILADVPCTGDGTLRKNLDIWKSWTPGNGASLHPLQLRILLRAMQLLKPGGRMVYSTCSFNPTENEAVVAAALKSDIAQGEFRIVPQPEGRVLPGLKRRRGLTQWRIYSQDEAGALVHHPSQTHHFGYLTGVREKRAALGITGDEYFLQDDVEEALRACVARLEADDAAREVFDEGKALGLAGSGKITGRDKVLAASLWAPENAASLGLEHGCVVVEPGAWLKLTRCV
jgi:16S rRNA C967 or C1407 C5-methylase (RsmB/RsmF family)